MFSLQMYFACIAFTSHRMRKDIHKQPPYMEREDEKKQLKWWEIQVQEKQIFCLITSSLHSKSWLGFGWGLPLFKSTALNMFTHSKRNLFESTQYTRDWSFSLISCIIFPFVVISLFLHCFQLYLFNICLPFFCFSFSFVWIEIAICSKRCIYACVFEYGLSTFSCLWSGLLEDLSTWFHILTMFSMIYLKISYNCLHFLQSFRGFLPYEWDLKWFWMWLIWLKTDLNRNLIDSLNWLWCHLHQS